MTRPTAGPASVYALLAEGATIEIRHAVPGDFAAVKAMHEAMSAQSAFLRFFGISRLAPEREARRLTREPAADHAALLALLHGELVGVASYECTGQPGVAEIAFAVADRMHGQGIATLLLEHLVSLARRRQVRTFVAEVLPENRAMLNVFAAAGLPARQRAGDGAIEITIPLPHSDADLALDAYLDAVAVRERRTAAASLRHLLAPTSVVVVGAGRRADSVGRAILKSIVAQGFAGRVYAVNPNAPRLEGVDCLPSVSSLPEPVDLAVVAVPVPEVLTVADQCGRRGVRALVVITSGVDPATGAALLAACRRYGMRLAGPNCFGVAVPAIGLNATFAAHRPVPGRAGLVVQSGGVGVALLGHLSRLGIGVSSFASVGDKYDVSSNDLLLWWEQDGATELAVLHLESFGNPRKFARTARRVGRQLPVLTVNSGQVGGAAGTAGRAPGGTVTAQPAVRQALFEQAGIVATANFGELLDAAALLATQPLPVGPRVGVVSNAGEVGAMAADACAEAGLQVAAPDEPVRRDLVELLPPGATADSLVNATLAVTAMPFRQCLERVAADEAVDAVLALVVPTATGDLCSAVAAARTDKPLAAVVLDQPDSVKLLPRPGAVTRTVPAYASPDRAVRALAHAVRYHAWRTRPGGQIPRFGDLRVGDARNLVSGFLAATPGGGWLSAEQTGTVLNCYGISGQVGDRVRTGSEPRTAVRPWQVPGFGRIGEPSGAVGVELVVTVAQEPVFGPLVTVGPRGFATDVRADRVARLAPLSRADAADMVGAARLVPLLRRVGDNPDAEVGAVEDMLLRVSRLADDLPEIAELDLDPVVARPDGVRVVRARARAAPIVPTDPFLRRLR